MNPRRFIANSAPDALNPSVGIFSAPSKRLNVLFGSKPEVRAANREVRFAPKICPQERTRSVEMSGPKVPNSDLADAEVTLEHECRLL